MPIYEYHCPECGSNTSEFEKYDTSSTHLCPCGGITFRTLSVPQRAQVIEGMLNRGDDRAQVYKDHFDATIPNKDSIAFPGDISG